MTEAGFETIKVREFANRRLIRTLDLLFLPAALWFVLDSIGIRVPLLGRLDATRSLVRRLFEERYWNNAKGDGASFLVQVSTGKKLARQ